MKIVITNEHGDVVAEANGPEWDVRSLASSHIREWLHKPGGSTTRIVELIQK